VACRGSGKSETVDLWGMFSMNVYAKFRCAPLCIKKALGIFRELTTTTRRTTTRVAFWDPTSGTRVQKMYIERRFENFHSPLCIYYATVWGWETWETQEETNENDSGGYLWWIFTPLKQIIREIIYNGTLYLSLLQKYSSTPFEKSSLLFWRLWCRWTICSVGPTDFDSDAKLLF